MKCWWLLFCRPRTPSQGWLQHVPHVLVQKHFVQHHQCRLISRGAGWYCLLSPSGELWGLRDLIVTPYQLYRLSVLVVSFRVVSASTISLFSLSSTVLLWACYHLNIEWWWPRYWKLCCHQFDNLLSFLCCKLWFLDHVFADILLLINWLLVVDHLESSAVVDIHLHTLGLTPSFVLLKVSCLASTPRRFCWQVWRLTWLSKV